MCGILGVFGAQDQVVELEKSFDRMLIRQSHRGPDASMTFKDKNILLGHNRLAIIDLNHGSQPFMVNDRPWILVFNGEIYNFLEIKGELKSKGYLFSTNSDTEVLYWAWVEWGKLSVDKFRGMYSFAIYNKDDQSLFLARDPFGIKPLYYNIKGSFACFSSEFKIIIGLLGGIEWDINSIEEFYAWQFVPGSATVDSRVKKVLPGEVIKITNQGKTTEKIYKTTRYNNSANRGEDFLKVVSDSVITHTISDVGFGALLSGGLDSTLVCKILKDSGFDFTTYSLIFDKPEYSEKEYIDHASRCLKIPNKTQVVTAEDFKRVISSLSVVMDEPLGDSSIIPTYLISEFIRRDHKVAISGDGGDEMFGGYSSYGRILKMYSGTFYERAKIFKEILLNRRSKRMDFRIENLAWEDHLNQRYFVNKDDSLRLFGNVPYREKGKDLSHPVMSAMEDDIENYMVDDILSKVDRMSMSNSLEIRVPFIDKNVYSYSRNLSVHELFGKDLTTRKMLLKNALLPEFGESFVNRKKMGFGIPYSDWMREVYGKDLEQRFAASNVLSMLEGRQYILRKTREFLIGDDISCNLIWGSLMLVLWEEGLS